MLSNAWINLIVGLFFLTVMLMFAVKAVKSFFESLFWTIKLPFKILAFLLNLTLEAKNLLTRFQKKARR